MEIGVPGLVDVSVAVEDESQIGSARRAGSALARRAGLSETDTGRAAIVISELATNLIRHAHGGRLMMRALGGRVPGLEVLAVDRGPGIGNVGEAFRDGHSTGGTAGTGLGAVRRLAEFCDLYTVPGSGTAVVARIAAGALSRDGTRAEVGIASRPIQGEVENGDGWAIAADGDRTCILVVDGLGHGASAHAATDMAVKSFRANPWRAPGEMLQVLDAALRPTRGAAVAIALIDHNLHNLRYVGCGNIAGVIITGAHSKNLVSHNGTTGHSCRRFNEFTYEWKPESLLVMHSDGLHHNWRLDAYPGLSQRDPALVAAVLMRDFERGRDDSLVVVARELAA